MGEVDSLDERLDTSTFFDFALTHGLGNLQGTSLNSGNNTVTIRTSSGTLVKVLYNDGFVSGISAFKEDNNLS